MKLFFDTETTGLPPKGANYETDFNEFPHIVQLAWSFNNMQYDYIIKPDGYLIPREATKIHGITNEKANLCGIGLGLVLNIFLSHAEHSENIIGHNIYFDTSIIKANGLKIGIDLEYMNTVMDKSKRICTMVKSNKFMGLKQADSNRPKYPTLLELYSRLFGEEFPAHNAKADVEATIKCYDELVRIGII